MQRRLAILLVFLAAACASDVDLRLGGVSNSVGNLRFTRILAGAGEARVEAVAWYQESLVVVGGHFSDTTDFGTGPVIGVGYTAGFVAAYDATSGSAAWAHPFIGSSATDGEYQATASAVVDVVVAPSGTVYAIGSFGNTVDDGAGPITSTDGCIDGIVARYLPDGTPIEPFLLPKATLYAAAPMPDDGLVISGYEVLADCPWLEGGNAPTAGFIARLGSDGQVQWKVAVPATASIETLATSGTGEVLVKGAFAGDLAIGSLSIPSARTYGQDSFLALFSPAGAPTWLAGCLRVDEESDCSQPGGVTFSPSGDAFAIGAFSREVELAGTVIEDPTPETDANSTYVAALDERGKPSVLAVVDGSIGHRVAFRDAPAQLVIAGAGNPDAGTGGAYVAILAESRSLVSERGTGSGSAMDVAIGPGGEIALVGTFHGEADFGDGPVSAETDAHDEGDDGFVAIYDREAVENTGP